MKYDNLDLLRIARERARAAGLSQPRTVQDIENLTGFAVNGMPDPKNVGQQYHVNVITWSN